MGKNMSKKYLKMIILNLAIVLSAVFCYSEGFLALRPWDASILRAGMSIFVAIADVFAFFYGNHALLKPAERSFYTSDAIPDLGKAKEILSAFHGMKYFGKLSDTSAGGLCGIRQICSGRNISFKRSVHQDGRGKGRGCVVCHGISCGQLRWDRHAKEKDMVPAAYTP